MLGPQLIVCLPASVRLETRINDQYAKDLSCILQGIIH